MPGSAREVIRRATWATLRFLPQVWYKADLRVDDHEGLLAAVDALSKRNGQGQLIPLYVLDLEKLKHLAFLPSGPAGKCQQQPPWP